MKEKVKKIIFGYLPGFVLGVITTFSISVIAATYFPSNDVTYDNKESGLSSTDVQGAIDEIYGICTTPSTTGDWVLDNTDVVTSGDGLYKDEYEEGKYTYKGANPNNYVTFNNEKAGWRIISINSDGTVKIMREESITNKYWDSSDSNNWNRPASLNTYLNNDYYNSLTSIAQGQIVDGAYYAGAVTDNNNDMQDQISDEKVVTSKVKVALPTVSEYIRATSNTSCKTFSAFNNNYNTCKDSDWMKYSEANWWTLSPRSGSSRYVFNVYSNGIVYYYDYASSTNIMVRPVVTISSEVQITGGIGTESDPYTLS